MRTQSKENRSAVKSNAGFTLVEVMVSGGVMMVVVLGFLALNSQMQKQQRMNDIRSTATDFNKRLENIVIQRAADILKTTETNNSHNSSYRTDERDGK